MTPNNTDKQQDELLLVLGFDYGLSHIGVASGQSLTTTATPLSPINAKNGTPDWAMFDTLMRSWQAQLLVVGLPLHMNGAENFMSTAARRFAKQLQLRYKIPCVMADERLSSFSAQKEARDADGKVVKRHKKPKQTQSTHSLAACVILDTWFSLPVRERQQSLEQARTRPIV